MYKIQTITAGSAVASLDFTVPSGYDDLMLVLSLRSDTSGANLIKLTFNGSTSGYSFRRLRGTGSGADSYSESSQSAYNGYVHTTEASETASTFSNVQFYIPNYRGSSAKSFSVDSVTENNATAAYQVIAAGLWSGTDAISSLTVTMNSANFVQGSTGTLYGIRKYNTTATPKATGGIITYANGYWVHAFTASGTFTPTQNLTCEYLVIAGGGGGNTSDKGTYYGGGGGAGGYRSSVSGESSGGGASAESPLSLTASTNYTVTIGAGGSTGANGSNSVFSTITSTGGGAGGGSVTSFNGSSGGSGGGGRGIGGSTSTGGTGTTSQGYSGGNGISTDPFTGGGGGAGEAGNTDGQGLGGDGVSSSITGTAITRAGGGTGGYATARAGGDGGGGTGGSNTTAAIAGQMNTGSGGGGDGTASGTAGAAGGSGVVIIRYAA